MYNQVSVLCWLKEFKYPVLQGTLHLKYTKARFKDSGIHFLLTPAIPWIYDTSETAVQFEFDLQKKATNKFPWVLLEGTFKSSMTQ